MERKGQRTKGRGREAGRREQAHGRLLSRPECYVQEQVVLPNENPKEPPAAF